MHPELFSIGPLTIRAYGVATAIAFLAGIFFASKVADKEGYKKDVMLDLGLVIIIFTVLGARALYVIVNWAEYYSRYPMDMFKVWEGGLVFYGGLIGGAAGGAWWMKKHKIPVLKTADIFMPFLALAHAIGRIGCFFNGCCYGRVDHEHGVIFPSIGDNLPHIPIQLYESVLNFLNFVLLIFVYKNLKNKYNGAVFFLYFVTYGIIRMVIETFRGDAERGFVFGLSTSTFISIILLLAGISGLAYLFGKNGKEKKSQG